MTRGLNRVGGPSLRDGGAVFERNVLLGTGRTGAAFGRARAAEALSNATSARAILNDAVPEFQAGLWRLLRYEVSEARQKFGRSIIFCRISYENGGRIQDADLAVKLYGRAGGEEALRGLRAMREAGFAPPSGHRVPRPFGYSPEHTALLQERVSGTSWTTALREAGGEEAFGASSARAAEWLLRLQGSRVSFGEAGGAAVVGRVEGQVRELVREVSRHDERRARRLERAAGRLIGVLGEAAPLVPSHGDYHPENVLLDGAVTSVIDLDDLGRREAAYDVGYAIGQLLVMSRFRMGGLGPGAAAALSFWGRYEDEGEARWPRVAAQAARTFLQSLHYELCVLHNGRLDLLDAWTELTEAFLQSEGPETLEDLIRHS